ncbi:IS5 family transposase, partial [Methylothermus subterraneus]
MVDHRCHACQSPPSRHRRQRRQPGHGAHKRGLNTKIPLAVDAHGMPLRRVIPAGTTTADCTQAATLIEGIDAKYLLADKGYDRDALIAQAKEHGMEPVIPSRRNRRHRRACDKHWYRLRHRVENAFLHLKRWRGIATRYAKNTASFLAAVHIRCIAIWAS